MEIKNTRDKLYQLLLEVINIIEPTPENTIDLIYDIDSTLTYLQCLELVQPLMEQAIEKENNSMIQQLEKLCEEKKEQMLNLTANQNK